MKKNIKSIYILLIILVLGMLVFLFSACSHNKVNADAKDDGSLNSHYTSMTGDVIEEKVFDEKSAMQVVDSISLSLGITNVEKEVKISKVDRVNGDSFYRMQQYYKGIPVYGRNIVLSADEEGNVMALTANSSKIENVDTKPKATQKQIDLAIKRYFDTEDTIVETISNDKLFIYSLDKDGEPKLVYNLSIITEAGAFDVLVDAKTAEIIKCYDAIHYVQKEFECEGQEKLQKFIAESRGELNLMTYTSESGVQINVYIPKQKCEYTWYEDNNADLVTWESGKKVDASAVDAMANIEKTYKFFNNAFKRDSFDGNKSDINVYVHITGYRHDGINDRIKNNAFHWNSPNGTVFAFTKKFKGMLKDSEYSAELDVVAHEYMHGVESSISGMLYEGESGAIMEAYSDIFGELVEDYSNDGVLDGDCNWKLVNRNLKNPSSNNYPITYKGENWINTSDIKNDKGGVHTNNMVLSHAMYLMWNGIDGAKEEKIDMETLAELWYCALHLLQPDATFSQCANAVVITAQQMYQDNVLSENQLSCVKKAFEKVGIKTNSTVQNSVVNGSKIYAMDISKKKSYDNYHLVVEHSGQTVAKADIANEEGYTIDLEDGTYDVKVTDNAVDGSEYEYSVTINVCGQDGNTQIQNKVYIYTDFETKVRATDFSVPVEHIVTLGELSVIEPEVYPYNAKSYEINWSSSNENVATIVTSGKAGIITSHSKGITTITAELTSGDKTITKTTNLRVASQGRDTVLVLDISGSMSGTPMTEMKEAAIDFCQELLEDEYNNRVGLVFYDDEIYSTDLTNDLNGLINRIEDVDDGGTTNMEEAISTAKIMLDSQGTQDSIKNIVVMADGLPNEGKTSDSGSMQTSLTLYGRSISYANAVIDTAQEAMKTYNMYSLGFFHDLSGDSLTFATELMTQLTNQEDGYHQVEDAENLQFAFGDISEEISDGSKVIINIACPVDVTITYNGETISSAKESFNASTSFGSLQLLGSAQDIKVLSLQPGIEYDVQLTGTDVGEMNYSVNYLDENENVTDSREFVAVPITSTTIITSNTNNTIENMDLNIDENGDGEIDIIWSAKKNESGEITYDTTIEPIEEVVEEEPIKEPEEPVQEETGLEAWHVALIVIAVLSVCGLIVVLIVVLGKDKKEADEYVVSEEENVSGKQDEGNELQSESRTEDKESISEAAIIILSGPLAGAEIPLHNQEIIYIGKEPQKANIVFSGDFPSVSRLHCSVTYEEKFKKYFVTDCSKNGTFFASTKERLVKGKRTPVYAGTILLLGNDKATIQVK